MAAPNGDTEGLGLLLNESGKLSQLFGASQKQDAGLAQIQGNVVGAYRIYKRQKNPTMAKALLSLLANTTTINNLTTLVNTHAAISAGKLVAVRSKGHTKVEGVVQSVDVDAKTCAVQIYVRSDAMKRKRFVTTAQEADEIFAGMKQTDDILHNFSLGDVAEVGGVRCSEYEAKEARQHAD